MELPVLAVSCGSYRTIIVIILFIQTYGNIAYFLQ